MCNFRGPALLKSPAVHRVSRVSVSTRLHVQITCNTRQLVWAIYNWGNTHSITPSQCHNLGTPTASFATGSVMSGRERTRHSRSFWCSCCTPLSAPRFSKLFHVDRLAATTSEAIGSLRKQDVNTSVAALNTMARTLHLPVRPDQIMSPYALFFNRGHRIFLLT